MIKIKVTCDWCSNDQLYLDMLEVTPGCKGIWKNLELVKTEDYDYLVIFNYPQHGYDIKENKSILYHCEPKPWRDTLARTSGFYGENLNLFKHFTVEQNRVVQADWLTSMTYDDMMTREYNKSRLLSGLISNKKMFEGHMLRLEFLDYLDKLPYYEHYGNGGLNLQSYISSTPINKDRDIAIGRYKYTFAAENYYEPNYFTEKITSAIIMETLPFYAGCPNISDFIDPRCYILLDLTDPEYSLNLIRTSIEAYIWEERKYLLKVERKRLLHDHHFLEITRKIIEG
jgi:hypothetical protein